MLRYFLRLKSLHGVKKFKAMFFEQPLQNWVHMDGSKLGLKDSISIPLNLINIWLIYDFFPPFKPHIKHFKDNVTRPFARFVKRSMSNKAVQLIGFLLVLIESVYLVFDNLSPKLMEVLEIVRVSLLPAYLLIIVFELFKNRFGDGTKFKRWVGKLKMTFRNLSNQNT